MVHVNEPQVWTLIGVFGVSMVGLITLVSTSFVRVLRAEIGRIDVKIDGLQTEMSVRFDAVDRRFEGIDRRLDGVDRRLDGLDRKVEGLERKVEGLDRKVDGLDRDVRTLFRHNFGADNE